MARFLVTFAWRICQISMILNHLFKIFNYLQNDNHFSVCPAYWLSKELPLDKQGRTIMYRHGGNSMMIIKYICLLSTIRCHMHVFQTHTIIIIIVFIIKIEMLSLIKLRVPKENTIFFLIFYSRYHSDAHGIKSKQHLNV